MEIQTTKNDEKIASALQYGYTKEEVAIIKNTVAKKTTDTELAFFLNICKTTGLNPFTKEIWCYKDHQGNLINFASRDGFLKKAQQSPSFNGIRSSEVRSNDEFEMDVFAGKIHHKITKMGKQRGDIIGAYAVVFRKGAETTIEHVDFETYNKGYNTWKTHPAEMIKKVAEVHALKKSFGISGIQNEYDWNIVNDKVYPIDTEKKIGSNLRAFAEGLVLNSAYDEDTQEKIVDRINSDDLTSTELTTIINDLKVNQIDPITQGQAYNQGDIHKRLDQIDEKDEYDQTKE